MPVHSKKQAQIKAKAYISTKNQTKAQVKALLFDKALIKVLI